MTMHRNAAWRTARSGAHGATDFMAADRVAHRHPAGLSSQAAP
jgi:hypothetical protein